MPSIIPTTKPCTIQFKIIGCRNVQSQKFQTINNPYLEVDCGDIKISKKTQHCKVPTPDNPNFLEVLQFDVPLPLNSLYAPTLNARLYDDVGVRKKLLGTTSIPLKPYFLWTREERPRNNLPQVVSSIPGSSDAFEIEEEDESTITSEQIAKRKEQKELKLLKEKMEDLIPDDITKAKEDQKETFEILIDVDAEPGAGIRTMPEVSDTNVADGDEADKEPKQLTLQHELEFDLKKPPFDEFLLWRGQKYGGESFFTRLVREPGAPVGNRVVVGKIKGNISIYTQEKPAPNDSTKATALLREIYAPKPYVIRTYIIRGRQLVAKDINGKADPFIKFSNGQGAQNQVDCRDDRKKGTLKPDFYKCYEVPATIPGNSDLNIEIYDYDAVGSSELIGRTIIDLESRIMSPEWRLMDPKPKEIRALWSPSSSFCQGKLELWIEILTPEEARL
ncbi:MAG: hypothetical protein EZS28_044679, partial [Streblomastix strix]